MIFSSWVYVLEFSNGKRYRFPGGVLDEAREAGESEEYNPDNLKFKIFRSEPTAKDKEWRERIAASFSK